MYKYYFLLFIVALASATELDSYEEEDGEERTIFTSGGTYYIALSSWAEFYWEPFSWQEVQEPPQTPGTGPSTEATDRRSQASRRVLTGTNVICLNTV